MNPLYNIPSGMKVCTPSDTDDIDKNYVGLWFESGGNVSVQFRDGSLHTYSGVLKHQELWGEIKRVFSTGTTVTDGDIYLIKPSQRT